MSVESYTVDASTRRLINDCSRLNARRIFDSDSSTCVICSDVLWPVLQLQCHETHVLCATCWERILAVKYTEVPRERLSYTTHATPRERRQRPVHTRFNDESNPTRDTATDVFNMVARCPFCNQDTTAVIVWHAHLTMKCGRTTTNPDKHMRLCDSCGTNQWKRLYDTHKAQCDGLTTKVERLQKRQRQLEKKVRHRNEAIVRSQMSIDILLEEVARLTYKDHGVVSRTVYDMLKRANLLTSAGAVDSDADSSSESDSDDDSVSSAENHEQETTLITTANAQSDAQGDAVDGAPETSPVELEGAVVIE